ncbi:GerMN domain-containing protein [Planktothrix agardhii]|jgi:spore germination protein GerM|nr:GerMN domain-containing protein [Planktothrix agardhii]MBG0747128.1 GerMN domain-containing protein [Planktothrix agardhii KL2]MCF3570172.1 GerMN domain-containing protein [Planktothrix agardhii 1805]MCF3576446.1 GerMN domain-containing protein [Planktothrix agardhii 1812]MCF3579727.1 GerMN domain-containing protein [Planktothrix agardhii 1811]MCF3586778.1 GerMN domain-containing protein [Planktothrix agardhii 1803]
MEDPQKTRVIPVGIMAGIAACLIAVGAGLSWWTLSSRSPKEPVVSSPTLTLPQPTPSPSETVEKTLAIYWVEDKSGKLAIISQPVQIQAQNDPTVFLNIALDRLLAGVSDPNQFSEIPKGTKLLNLTTKNDEVYVDLSPEFTQGGGSASMTGRLGQIVYTSTTLNPNSKVWLSVAGKPLTVLGGEGLEIAQPITRSTFDREFRF